MQTRNPLARLMNSRATFVGLSTAAVLAVAGTTYGYSSMSHDVTVSLDGQQRQVSAMSGTVGEVLDEEGIEVSDRDVVAPGLDEEVTDGSAISVRFARPLELTVDGKTSTHWVTATDVAGALTQLGSRFAGADLSVSRGGSIDREGMDLRVVTEKTLDIKVADDKVVTRKIPAMSSRDALEQMGVEVEKRDEVTPAPGKKLDDGDRIVFTDIDVKTKRVKDEAINFSTVEREDSSIYEGETKTVRSGQDGVRDVTYQVTTRNGEVVATKVLRAKVLEQPVDAIVKVGTKQEEVAPTTNYASGSTVWDQIAQCESGGNWAINTGNGYYGGLQFNVGTWQSYGGTGLPSDASRETQIAIAEKVRAATGGYGSWPACSASLGLPQ